MQVAAAMWHVCEDVRQSCCNALGDIVIAMRTDGIADKAQPELAVAVAATCADMALRAVHLIVRQTSTLEAVA